MNKSVGTALAHPRPPVQIYPVEEGRGRAKAVPTLSHIFGTLLYIPTILTVFSLVGTISWLQKVMYRLGQVRQQLGFVAPLTPADTEEVARWLPASALPLFQSMSRADQQHSLRVCRGLLARDCSDKDMLAAALLHDVGKAEGRVPFWTRPAIVIGRRIAPRLLKWLAVCPLHAEDTRTGKAGWRRALGYAWWHAEVGAELAERAGLSERAVLYIRTHHQPAGPAAELHSVDEVS